MNTYVMSDIHGCYDEFQQMLEKIHFNNRDLLICAGDYIDRGTKNYEMMSWISNAPENVVFVRGNHDEEFLTNIRIMKYVCDEAELDEASICNGEQVAGFKDIHTGKIEEVMLIKNQADLDAFKKMYGIDGEIEKEY